MYNESSGPSLSREAKRKPELHHLRIYGHPDSTNEKPMWLVEHHASQRDRQPEERAFSDGHAMLAHIAEHAAVPNNEDHEVLPNTVENLSGRAQ
jgi:hypothetical protein